MCRKKRFYSVNVSERERLRATTKKKKCINGNDFKSMSFNELVAVQLDLRGARCV